MKFMSPGTDGGDITEALFTSPCGTAWSPEDGKGGGGGGGRE